MKEAVSKLRGITIPRVHFPSLNSHITQIGGRNRLNQIRRALTQPGQPSDTVDEDQAILDALITLRVVELRKTTNQLNVPDIYPVAAGTGRRGGVAIRR